jgi:transposase
MLTNLFFPHVAGVRVERLWRDGATIHLEVVATRRRARCPLCHRRSRRPHSLYERTLADLPCGGDRVVLHLHVRRFLCRVRWCRRKIFAERLPDLVAPFARRTARLTAHLLRAVFDLGGEGGARHAAAEGTPVSARTLLRLIRSAPLPAAGPVRVLGVDDWSRRKGRSYGTILVNLETHTVIDLLPDRTAETLAAWLRQHPELEIVSRDRSGAYAEGIRHGAPQALQVADRFHLHKNVTDALERYLTRKHTAVRQAAQDGHALDTPVTAEPPAAATPSLPSREQPERRAHRLARYEEVVALRACGASVRTIAARVGIGQRTVQRWLRAGRFPERRQRSEHPGQVAPFAAYLRERWAQGCQNATQLWHELRERGYTGCYGSVAALVAPWRGERYHHRGQVKERRLAAAEACASTPRQVCWLLLKAPDDLTPDEQAYLTRLYHAYPQVAVAEALVEEFGAVLRERDVEGLYTWLRGAEASGIKELQGVARSLRLDRQAVEAAVRLDWSNGQVEGKVNKLKTTKRAQYGRATFDLLRRRVLHAA